MAASNRMDLTYDGLLPYPGYEGIDGLCHVRLYMPRAGWRRPVAIVGGLDDNPGTSITGAAEALAAEIGRELLPAQRWPLLAGRRLRIVEHYPEGLAGDGPSFQLLRFKLSRRHARTALERVSRRTLSLAQARQLVGCEVRVWQAGGYTASAVAGERGEAQLRQVAATSGAHAERLRASLRWSRSSSERLRSRSTAASSSSPTASS